MVSLQLSQDIIQRAFVQVQVEEVFAVPGSDIIINEIALLAKLHVATGGMFPQGNF